MTQEVEDVDICIIGANIAGNYLSFLLRNSGLKIVVIEEHQEIGLPLQCAGIVSSKLSHLIDLPNHIVRNRVHVAKIVSPSGKMIKLRGQEHPYIIDRVALDRLFFEKNEDHESIIYYLGEKFNYFKYIVENNQKRVLIYTNKRILKSSVLVGCDGPLSSVGKGVGVKNNNLFATQIRIHASHFNQDEAAMYFDPKWKELFGWIVPEGDGVCRIGIASAINIGANLKTFLKRLNLDPDLKIDQQGGLIPYGMMNRVAFDNIILVGDAGCQVKATTGGGIIMLLTAAKYAAYSIIQSFKKNNFSKRHFRTFYQSSCLATIGKQLKIHYFIRMVFAHFSSKDYDIFFQILKSSNIEHIISFYGDMDFPKRLLFKMLRNSLVLKFLFKVLTKNPSLIRTIITIFKK